MKKYRLKEEVRKYYINCWQDDMPLGKWREQNVSEEALEEVPQRIELKLDAISDYVYKRDGKWNIDDLRICEKALNGELLDIDSLDVYYFEDWFHSINTKPYVETKNIITVLKAYLKHKQNG